MPFSTRNLVLRASLGTSTLSLLFPDLTVNFYTVQLIHNSALFGSHGISAMTPIILDIQLSCQQRYLIFAHQKNVRVHYLISLGWYISRISRLTFFFFFINIFFRKYKDIIFLVLSSLCKSILNTGFVFSSWNGASTSFLLLLISDSCSPNFHCCWNVSFTLSHCLHLSVHLANLKTLA